MEATAFEQLLSGEGANEWYEEEGSQEGRRPCINGDFDGGFGDCEEEGLSDQMNMVDDFIGEDEDPMEYMDEPEEEVKDTSDERAISLIVYDKERGK